MPWSVKSGYDRKSPHRAWLPPSPNQTVIVQNKRVQLMVGDPPTEHRRKISDSCMDTWQVLSCKGKNEERNRTADKIRKGIEMIQEDEFNN